jgi:hypothetical protein
MSPRHPKRDPICTVRDCNKPHSAFGFCDAHLWKYRRYGDPLAAGKQASLAATRSPTATDLAWAAGFLEGEGYFGTESIKSRVSATQINTEPLQKLRDIFGGSISMNVRRLPKLPVSVWQANGARARGITMTLYSFMSSRRRNQIRLALGRSYHVSAE